MVTYSIFVTMGRNSVSIWSESFAVGSRRWNWKYREKHFWNPNPELLLHSSYSFWPRLSTSGSGWESASTLPWKKCVKYIIYVKLYIYILYIKLYMYNIKSNLQSYSYHPRPVSNYESKKLWETNFDFINPKFSWSYRKCLSLHVEWSRHESSSRSYDGTGQSWPNLEW